MNISNIFLGISLIGLLTITLRENLITKTEEEKKSRKEKILQRSHTLLSILTSFLLVLNFDSNRNSYLFTLAVSIYLFSILANTSFFLNYVMSPLAFYSWIKDRALDVIILFKERKTLEQLTESSLNGNFKNISQKYATFLKEKRKAYRESKNGKKKREYFKTSFLISRETFALLLVVAIINNLQILKFAIEQFGLNSLTWFTIFLSWMIFISAILRGIWGHIKLSSIANKIGETKQSFDNWLKQVPPIIEMVVKLIFNLVIYSLVKKYDAPSVVKGKVEKFFNGSDSIFEYLLNAIRLYPLIKTLISFMFRFYIVSVISASIVKMSIPTEARVTDIALDISGIFFGASELSFDANGMIMILIKNLHILSWISQFALFSLLATSFSISITHLSEKTRMFYEHYKKPINEEILKAIFNVNSRQLKRAKEKIIKNVDLSALTPEARKNLEELEKKILDALE